MQEHAENLHFEEAQKIKEKLDVLENYQAKLDILERVLERVRDKNPEVDVPNTLPTQINDDNDDDAISI